MFNFTTIPSILLSDNFGWPRRRDNFESPTLMTGTKYPWGSCTINWGIVLALVQPWPKQEASKKPGMVVSISPPLTKKTTQRQSPAPHLIEKTHLWEIVSLRLMKINERTSKRVSQTGIIFCLLRNIWGRGGIRNNAKIWTVGCPFMQLNPHGIVHASRERILLQLNFVIIKNLGVFFTQTQPLYLFTLGTNLTHFFIFRDFLHVVRCTVAPESNLGSASGTPEWGCARRIRRPGVFPATCQDPAPSAGCLTVGWSCVEESSQLSVTMNDFLNNIRLINRCIFFCSLFLFVD